MTKDFSFSNRHIDLMERDAKTVFGWRYEPRIILESGKGVFVTDVDGNEFIDYVLSWGPLVLGHAHPHVVEAVTKAMENGASFGIPTEAEWQRRYCELTGRDEIENWPFYVAYNLFRLAAIIQGVYKRGLDGIASSDFQLDEQRERVFSRAERGWALVEQMR